MPVKGPHGKERSGMRKLMCDVSGQYYDADMMAKCKHPAVLERFGHNKKQADVSVYTCHKCKYGVKPYADINAVRCVYGR